MDKVCLMKKIHTERGRLISPWLEMGVNFDGISPILKVNFESLRERVL